MTKSSLNKLMLTASSLGIISLIAVPQASAGTITITPEGTIYTQQAPKVLGDVSNPQIEAIQAKMKAEGDALLEQYKAGDITYDEVKAKKLAIVEKYKAELQAAKQPLIDQAKQQAEANKVKVSTQAKTVEVKPAQENKVRVQTAPTEKTVAAPLAEEDEVIFVQKVADAEEKTRIMSKDQNKYMITNGVAAKVGTPLSFNLETNEMTVTTPNGTKTVAVLPDAALAKARLEANIDVTPISDNPEDVDETGQVTLMDYQDSPTYAVKGKAKKNLFGIIPLELDKTVYVSAVSGNVVSTEQTPFAQFIDIFSF